MRRNVSEPSPQTRRRIVLTCAIAGFGLCAFSVLAADSSKKAPAPKFGAAVDGEPFFKDARLQLKGAPPVFGTPTPSGSGSTGPGGPTDKPEEGSDGNQWSALVSTDTLEAEIKAQPAEIEKAMKAPNPHKDARMVVTYLAALYNVIFKYDKADVRWKADSHALRDSFAKGGQHLKAWTAAPRKHSAQPTATIKAPEGRGKWPGR